MDDGGTEPRGNSISYDGRNHRRGGECTRLGAAADFLVLRMVKRALVGKAKTRETSSFPYFRPLKTTRNYCARGEPPSLPRCRD